jgi:hypothetical protein
MDIPRIFNITKVLTASTTVSPEKLATLGAALRLRIGSSSSRPRQRFRRELCTWAHDHGIIGIGVDISQLFTEQAKLRAEELGVTDKVKFIHGDAAGYVSDEKVNVAACVGATLDCRGSSRHD